MVFLEVYINGNKQLTKTLEHIDPKEIIKTIEMIIDYTVLHKGNKIAMLKGIHKIK